jgi:hypothetical protein
MFQEWNDFVQGADFIVPLERLCGRVISDEQACEFASAQAVLDFACNSMTSKSSSNRGEVWAAICKIASDTLELRSITPDIDILAPFRKCLEN